MDQVQQFLLELEDAAERHSMRCASQTCNPEKACEQVWELFSPRPDSMASLEVDVLLSILEKIKEMKDNLVTGGTVEMVTVRGRNEVKDGVSFM